MSKPFRFKQFKIDQDQCAMKVSTDGILLGAWTSVDRQPNSLLDIGAGTGLLSLMLAQRCTAHTINAIEIDAPAHEQCTSNFRQSPWHDRLQSYHMSLETFAAQETDRYDLIVCNPPFYTENYRSKDSQRDTARYQDAMPFNKLLESVASLMSIDGLFSVIIPYSEVDHFLTLAHKVLLYANRITHAKGTPTSDIKRSLIEFTFIKGKTTITELTIETTRHNYTAEYTQLTKGYYLKM